MPSSKIDVKELSRSVMSALEQYGAIASADVKDAVTKTSKECVQDIKRRATAYGWRGKYVNSWSKKVEPLGAGGFKAIVYADENGYRLAHLLEKGHALRNGGRAKAFPHIAPAEDNAEQRLFTLIRQALGG